MDKITNTQIPNYDHEKKFLSLIGNMGFLLAYNYRTTGPDYLDCTYPKEWQETYAREFLVAQDPTVTYSMAVPGDYRWSEIIVPDYFKLFERASSFQLNYGATLSRREGLIGRSFLAVARNDRELTDEELTLLSEKLDHYRGHFSEANPLSSQEIMLLKLLADDMSIEEVSDKLKVSRSTANGWVKSIKKKLGCLKITRAIVIATKRNWV